MITFIFRIAGESAKTRERTAADLQFASVCVTRGRRQGASLCSQTMMTASQQQHGRRPSRTAVSMAGEKKKKIERERQMEQNRNGYFCNCRPRGISQSKEMSAPTAGLFAALLRRIVGGWGGGGEKKDKQRKVFQLLCVVSGRSGRVLPRFIRCAHRME